MKESDVKMNETKMVQMEFEKKKLGEMERKEKDERKKKKERQNLTINKKKVLSTIS